MPAAVFCRVFALCREEFYSVIEELCQAPGRVSSAPGLNVAQSMTFEAVYVMRPDFMARHSPIQVSLTIRGFLDIVKQRAYQCVQPR